MGKPTGKKGKFRQKREKPEFDQQIVDLARVTRVTKGGKQLSFRAGVVIGDRKGRVGYGVDKGKDVQIAVEKAVNQAKKTLIRVPIVNDTIPHRADAKFGAAKVMLKPAPRGSGVIAGSAVRVVLELAGVPNASAKILGKTNNKINNIKATFACLQSFLPSAVGQVKKVAVNNNQKIEKNSENKKQPQTQNNNLTEKESVAEDKKEQDK